MVVEAKNLDQKPEDVVQDLLRRQLELKIDETIVEAFDRLNVAELIAFCLHIQHSVEIARGASARRARIESALKRR